MNGNKKCQFFDILDLFIFFSQQPFFLNVIVFPHMNLSVLTDNIADYQPGDDFQEYLENVKKQILEFGGKPAEILNAVVISKLRRLKEFNTIWTSIQGDVTLDKIAEVVMKVNGRNFENGQTNRSNIFTSSSEKGKNGTSFV